MLTKRINLKREDKIKVNSLKNKLTRCYNIEDGKNYILTFKTMGYTKWDLGLSIRGHKQALERVFPKCTFMCALEEQLVTVNVCDDKILTKEGLVNE